MFVVAFRRLVYQPIRLGYGSLMYRCYVHMHVLASRPINTTEIVQLSLQERHRIGNNIE